MDDLAALEKQIEALQQERESLHQKLVPLIKARDELLRVARGKKEGGTSVFVPAATLQLKGH